MATELQTKIEQSISLIDLKLGTKEILRDFFGKDVEYQLITDIRDKDIPLNSNQSIIVSERNHPEEIVELTFTYQASVVAYEDPEEEGWWATATIRAAKDSSLKFNLAAILIIYLASLDSSDIIDESRYWTSKRKLSFDEFKSEFVPK